MNEKELGLFTARAQNFHATLLQVNKRLDTGNSSKKDFWTDSSLGGIRPPYTPWTGLFLAVYCNCLLCVCLFDFSFTPIEVWIKVMNSDDFVGSLDSLHFDGVGFCYRAAFMSYQCKMFLCFIVI